MTRPNENAGREKRRRWLRRSGVVLALLILLFVIDVATRSFALYGWEVPVLVRAVDAATGAPIADATLSYAYAFGEADRYETLGAAATEPTLPMTYCRGESVIASLFRGPPRPDLATYRFDLAAAGFSPRRINATAGELIEDTRGPEGERLALRLPDVRLERSPGS